jgi:hypothetical protein
MALSGGILTAFLIVYVCSQWAWCARWAGTPGIDPETIKAVHLSTWYFFDMTYNITNVQLLGCGLFAILDRSEHRIFPAWLGWFCLFTAASFFLETIMPYFNHGRWRSMAGGTSGSVSSSGSSGFPHRVSSC